MSKKAKIVIISLIILLAAGYLFAFIFLLKNNDKSTTSSNNNTDSSQSISNKDELLAAADKYCGEQPSMTAKFVTGSKSDNSGNEPLVIDGGYAFIFGGCENGSNGQVGKQGYYFKKDSNGSWVYYLSTTQVLSCSKWDGTGWPASVVGKCWDTDNTQRDPR